MICIQFDHNISNIGHTFVDGLAHFFGEGRGAIHGHAGVNFDAEFEQDIAAMLAPGYCHDLHAFHLACDITHSLQKSCVEILV